jgi:hypothetical protein
MPDDWTADVDLDLWMISSGPDARHPPELMTGDFLLLHAVIHARLFAAVQLLDNPQTREKHPESDKRFPWSFHVRVDTWVPLISDAPKTSDIASKNVMGAIRHGAYYVKLTKSAYDDLLGEIRAVSSAKSRN